MPIKQFNEMLKLDLSEYISKKPTFRKDANSGKFVKTDKTLDYISWADCLELLYLNGAEKVLFGNVRSQNDHPLFLLNGGLPFIRVFVDIDGERRELDYPLIDGSTNVKIDKADQSDVHNATQRAFVKCVAINWGLGLSLWQKEEKETPARTPADDDMNHNLWAIKKRIEELITRVMRKNDMTQKEICDAIGMKESILSSTMITAFNNIDLLEARLQEYDK